MTPSTVYSPSGQALSEKFLTRFRAVATPQPRLRKAQPWKLSPSNAARRPDIANAATGRHPFHRESLYLHPRWQRARISRVRAINAALRLLKPLQRITKAPPTVDELLGYGEADNG